MGATTVGALIGGAIDSMSGDDSAADGAVTANVLKLVVPVAVTWLVGWAVLRGAAELKDTVFGDVEA